MIGQIVQYVKPQPSKDDGALWRHYAGMDRPTAVSEFRSQLCARVKRLRMEKKHFNGKPYTSADMATALRIPADAYRKYENRTPMPHNLIEPFAMIVERSVEYVLTGKSGAIPDDNLSAPQRRARKRT